MEPTAILQILLSWQFILFSLSAFAVVFVFRKTAEYLIANFTVFSKESKLWTDLILPILPVFIGVLGGSLFKTFPYPDGITTGVTKIMFGLVAGLFSGLVYRMVNSFFGDKLSALFKSTTNSLTPNQTTNETAPDQ